MRSLQAKLLAALGALILLVVGISGVLAERGLRARQMERIERSLSERARLVRELARGRRFEPGQRPALDEIADRAAVAAAARVTFIDADGAVVGDSDLSLSRLPAAENHADRPEVQAALRGEVGRSSRLSETVGRRLLYLALPIGEGEPGVVRLAVDLSDLESSVGQLRRELLTAGAVGLVAALAFSYALTSLALRPIREVQRAAAAIARGELDARAPLRMRAEFGDISSALNEMGDQLRRRLAEATSEKERLQAVLNAMVEGVLVVGAGGEILLANERLREFYGVWGDVLGRPVLEAIRDAELEVLLSEAEQTEEPVSRQLAVERFGMRTLQVHAARFPAEGQRIGTVAVFHDVTELTRLEQVRQDFVANASHELRTPLAAIRGFAETLLANRLPDSDRRGYLEIIDRHARRLSNLVDDLLALSRIESRDASFDLTRVDVGSLVATLVRDGQKRFAERKLTVDLRAVGSGAAWADPQAVDQVLTNLLDNAVKYTDAGGRIEVCVESGERFVRVRVADTGIGIPGADRDRIFERFYRVDKARSRALGGTGLGLSIVKHLVQRMGGEIFVESEPGQGSTFTFTLPREPRPSV